MLVLAGSNGFGCAEVMREVEASPRARDILVTGYLPESALALWYGRAGIFAFPSLDEGFGMPVLEAMAAGVPVMASNRSALPEVCGDAAVMIDPQNEDELAHALTALAQDTDLRMNLIVKGTERAKSFRWIDAVERTMNVYREMV
jgi:glycosyltransferase involved in cell wall biosynthesis